MSSGYKSGLWFERLSASVGVQRKAGYKSFLAFWMGGASAVVATPVPPAPVPVVIESRRWPGPSTLLYGEWDYPTWHKKREEEEIVFL